MKSIKHPVLSLLIAAGLLAGTAAIQAQEDYQPPAPVTPEEHQQVNVSDAEISNFVTAYLAVQDINQEYTEKLQAAESPEQATELQQEAQDKMQEAVTESGLSISEYQQIANLANQNPELRERISAALSSHLDS